MTIDLAAHLQSTGTSSEVQSTILASAQAGVKIYQALKTQKIEYSAQENSSGEVQLSHDLIADEILKDALQESGAVSCFVSEERESDVCFIQHVPEKLLVAFDPIDGSSVAASGLAVGTSLGIYQGRNTFLECTGRDQVAAMYMLYGPRIVLVYSVGEGVHLFAYDEDQKEFSLEQSDLSIKDHLKVCSIGSLQKSCEITGFPDLINYWQKESFSLRYSGSMAADMNGILKRGGGVFAYPASKLRLLYECNPFAFLMEQAGGMARDMCGRDILDLKINQIDSTSPILIGAKAEVEMAEKFLFDNCKIT